MPSYSVARAYCYALRAQLRTGLSGGGEVRADRDTPPTRAPAAVLDGADEGGGARASPQQSHEDQAEHR